MSAHLSEAERDELAEFIGEWRTTCRMMSVAYTPESIARWLSDSEVVPRISAAHVAAAVAAEREAWVGKIEALAVEAQRSMDEINATPDPLTGRHSTMRAFVFADTLRALIAEARS